ncbi:ATP-dependent DNA helicase mph1 [Wickerhamiella sorbophila]|uniref:ATP-dependent DNA helicase n=1 Tax=Wickerhamiella sorbophila TaxID=45607 RepID=A0A2T0FD51_9ASCO|nr:ATP-dependent DNA helicase mph1 [Wickerhamiella sorbophila]PRT52901.1 ATP-dependent DNA helicase mph1 [Wickerhamiella sorbophila]
MANERSNEIVLSDSDEELDFSSLSSVNASEKVVIDLSSDDIDPSGIVPPQPRKTADSRPASSAPRMVQTKLPFVSSSPVGVTIRSSPVSSRDSNSITGTRIFDLSSQPPDETPTHHAIDYEKAKAFVYPVDYPVRDYQRNIIRKALLKNVMCALPTGLGKTFIASIVMLNWFRWTKDAKIIFVAPTRPLVSQQVTSFLEISGVSVNTTCAFIQDLVKRNQRAEQWQTKRVFFATPQTVVNDINAGLLDPQSVVCLVVDEAHRATGNHSYVELVKLLDENKSFRILALTATPSGHFEGVQEVIDNLHISHTEFRSDSSLDLRPYLHNKKVERIVTPFSKEQQELIELVGDLLTPFMPTLLNNKVIYNRDPTSLHHFQLLEGLKKYSASPAARSGSPIVFQVRAAAKIVLSVLYAMGLLKTHGIYPFYERMRTLQAEYDDKKGKAGKNLTKMVTDKAFQRIMQTCQQLIYEPSGQRRLDFFGHPKLERLVEIVKNFFLTAGASGLMIIFAEFRDSAAEIMWVLKNHCSDYVEPSLFVGQASKQGGVSVKGMSQKEQRQIIDKFKTGEINVLIATSIAEEGLDIGQVQCIVCYDQSQSPIRSIQRMGRTGRKGDGSVYLLMTEKEKDKNILAVQGHKHIQKLVETSSAGGKMLVYHESSRIIPAECSPKYEEIKITVPQENLDALSAGDILDAMRAFIPRKRTTTKRKRAESPEEEKPQQKQFTTAFDAWKSEDMTTSADLP